MTVETKGIITAPQAAFAILPPSAARVRSWDNDTAPKAQAECRAALKAAGFYCESVYRGKDGAKNQYGLYVYRTREDRAACFAAHASPTAGMYHYRR
jgi:hypothetical protein